MRADGPAPSLRSLVATWLSLTGQVFSSAFHRANILAESSAEHVRDAVMDLGSPPARCLTDGDELPPLDPRLLALAMTQHMSETWQQVSDVINDDPHGCLDALTRDRVHTLFRELADLALAEAKEQRIAAAELGRGEIEDSVWVKKYRRILAAEGRWPPAEDRTEEEHGEEGASKGE